MFLKFLKFKSIQSSSIESSKREFWGNVFSRLSLSKTLTPFLTIIVNQGHIKPYWEECSQFFGSEKFFSLRYNTLTGASPRLSPSRRWSWPTTSLIRCPTYKAESDQLWAGWPDCPQLDAQVPTPSPPRPSWWQACRTCPGSQQGDQNKTAGWTNWFKYI